MLYLIKYYNYNYAMLQSAKISKVIWMITKKIDYAEAAKTNYMSMYVYYFKENVALNQLSKMREHLDKRTEDLGLSAEDAEDRQTGNGRRRSSVWEGLAEVWKFKILVDHGDDDENYSQFKKWWMEWLVIIIFVIINKEAPYFAWIRFCTHFIFNCANGL